MNALRVAGGELAATGLLVLLAFLSGLARAALGSASLAGALVGSLALGLGYGLVILTFGPLSQAQANPLISALSSLGGGQTWAQTALRGIAQLLGGVAATAIVVSVPFLSANGSETVRPVADGVAAFGFVLVAMGVAGRQDASVPAALGAFATASFWMTGRASLGNPLVATALAVAATTQHSMVAMLWTLLGVTCGSAFGAATGWLVLPEPRRSLALLVYRPKAKTHK